MMRLTLNGKPYVLVIDYSPSGSTIAKLLIDEEGKKLGELSRVADGIAYLHPKDRFRKSAGRKIAIAKAISSFPKAMRAEIWQQIWDSGMKYV